MVIISSASSSTDYPSASFFVLRVLVITYTQHVSWIQLRKVSLQNIQGSVLTGILEITPSSEGFRMQIQHSVDQIHTVAYDWCCLEQLTLAGGSRRGRTAKKTAETFTNMGKLFGSSAIDVNARGDTGSRKADARVPSLPSAFRNVISMHKFVIWCSYVILPFEIFRFSPLLHWDFVWKKGHFYGLG